MSTRSYTTNQQAPYHQGSGPSWFRIWSVVIGTMVAAALVALTVAVWPSHSSPATATSGTQTSTSVPANPAKPTTPAHPVQPSAAVAKLQRELGQLNYYEGADDGLMGPQTIQAIKYLQRDAGLPQTGQMNAATQAALANFLAHGNNQMGG
jgi:peptidoglycan hydrolase-like protein with peptidoglycan-binding domain